MIAEDLGFLTDSVRELLADSGYPGMKVLQFAFDESGESVYLPFSDMRRTAWFIPELMTMRPQRAGLAIFPRQTEPAVQSST